jgi:GLPGLI family protein
LTRLILFVFCFGTFTTKCKAQPGFTITYDNFSFYIFDSLGNPLRPFASKNYNTVLVINGSQSYYYTSVISNNSYPVKKILGKKFRPHTNYINTEKNILVSQFGDKYRVREPLKKFNWNLLTDITTLAGYECKKAFCLNEGDSIVVLYTEKLSHGFGPYTYTGLPGTILEVTTYRKENIFRITAIRVENKELPIVEPTDGNLITWEKWKKIIANRKPGNGIIRVVTF